MRIAQAGILIVFFQAGVQKLVHGYYIDGQLLALRVLYDEGEMGRRLRGVLSYAAQLLDILPLPPAQALSRPSFIAEADVSLPDWVRAVLCMASNTTWMSEMGLPILVFNKALRARAIYSLLALEAVILFFSGEVSFGLTVLLCVVSMLPCLDPRRGG